MSFYRGKTSLVIAGILIGLLAGALLTGCAEVEPKVSGLPYSVYSKRIMSDREDAVERAMVAIGSMGSDAIPFIKKDYKKAIKLDNDNRKIQLLRAFGRLGVEGSSGANWLESKLEQEVNEVVIAAVAEAIAGVGPALAGSVPKLSSLLKSSDYSTQVWLLNALGALGPASVEAIPLVLEAIERPKTREAAIIALSQMGEEGVQSVIPWLDNGNLTQRILALEILIFAGDQATYALPALAKAINDKDPKVVTMALRALANTGPKAFPQIDDLIQLLSHSDSEVRWEASLVIIGIGGSLAGDKMIAAIDNEASAVRETSIRIVGRWESVRLRAEKKLLNRLGEENVHVRVAAIDVLSDMKEDAVADVIPLLSSKNVLRQAAACTVLGKIGSAAKGAKPKLRELLKSKDSLVRNEAKKALKSI